MEAVALLICGLSLLPSAGEEGQARRRLDEAREHFSGGYYRLAFDEFKDVAGSAESKLLPPARVGMADCQAAWGDYEGALATLHSIFPEPAPSAKTDSPEWHRALGGVYCKLGHYDQAMEAGEQAIALDPHHARARYELGCVYELAGRRDEALKTYAYFDDWLTNRFPETAADAHYAGMGFYRYSVLAGVSNLTYRTKYVLQDVLQKACEVMDRTYWPARLAIADLLFEKHNLEEAMGDYKQVLKQNPHCLEAHLGLARIALDAWNFADVESRVAVCLDLNPRSAQTHVVLAALRMIERRFEEAASAAEQALSVNPNHIEALSYLAAARTRLGQSEEAQQAKKKVYAINARPAAMHTILGQQLGYGRQFPEAEQELLKAIEFDPTDATPRNELAMMYMQWGYEDKARQVVSAALDIDAFNSQTYNTERLLDELAGFAAYQSENFEIHFDAGQDAVLGEYTAEYLESIYTELCEDYETALPDKTIIEFFPDHRKFGVRIHGKPWIHTVGACTGRVIAMDAPRRDVMGNYNVAHVLRHEFTHTVTLAATNNRIPHWLTEGLAVLQEDRPRSWSWKQSLTDRLRRGQLFTLETIDWGFARPRRPDDSQVAYAQSEWMCEYLIGTYGYGVINRMLGMYRAGRVQREVIPAVTGMSLGEFDLKFRAWALEEARSWDLPLDPTPAPWVVSWLLRFYSNSPELHAQMAEILTEEEDFGEAQAHAERALELQSNHAAALKAAAQISLRLAAKQPSRDRAQELVDTAKTHYERLAEHHPDEPVAAEFLAEYANGHDDREAAMEWAKRLKQLQPQNPASYRILSGIYLHRDDDAAALPELMELAQQDEHDADVPRQLARIYRQRGELQEAARWYRESVHIDPYDVQTHRDYGRLLDELNERDRAIHEYRMLTVLAPDKAAHFSELAFAYHRAGRRDQAVEAARAAVKLDANAPARQLLAE